MQRLLIGAAAAAVASMAAGAAKAQEAASPGRSDEELVVTAQRIKQNLQVVPVSVTAVTGADLAARKLNDLTQIQLVAPSFQTTTDNAFSLRGIGSNIFLATVDSSVGVMVDDVSLGVPLFQSNGVFNDIARIEVLKGPQGILFGRNASAGLLNIVTNRPRLGETSGSFGVEYNNRDTAAGGHFGGVARATLNLPVSETAALRINLLGSKQDPIAKAIVTSPEGSKIDEDQTRLGARVKFLWEPDAETNLFVSADYSRERGAGGIWDRTLRTIGAGTYAAALQRIGAVAGPKNLKYGIDAPANYRSVDTYGASVSFEHELTPSVTLSNIVAWRQFDLDLWLDTDYSTNNLFNTNTNQTTNRQFSEELRLAFETDRVDGQVGLYYFSSRNEGQTQLFAAFGTGIPNYFGGDFVALNTADSYAAFGQVNFHVTEAFTVFAGGRVTHDEVSMTTTQDVGTYVVPPGLYGPSGTFSFDESHTDFSYKLGAQYQATPDIMVYLTYGTGYKGPAYPQNLGSSAFDPYIAPETVEDWEGGIRSTFFDKRVRLNVSAFHQQFSDFQTQTYDPVAALFRLANAGGVKAYGVEIDASAGITDHLTVNFGATLASTRFTDFITTCYPGQTAAQGCVSGRLQADGLAPPNAPDFTSSLQVLYDIPLGENLVTIEGNWFHRSKVNFSPNGDPGTELGAVDILGASLTYTLQDRYRFSLFCKNCANEYVPSFLSHVAADATAILQSWNFNSVRTIGLSFDYEF
jgi:iron complex outermembrane receptor protein